MESSDHTYPRTSEGLTMAGGIQLDADILAAFEQQARHLRMPVAELVNQVLRRHLEGAAKA